MPFTIVRQDITKIKVDAIVNAANTELKMGGGVCGAIFRAAGEAELQAACDRIAPIRTGDAVITPGFGLPAKFVIHTAGPVYRDGKHSEEQLLRSCYLNSLKRAIENQCESIAFPLISSGIYGYPKAEALKVAVSAIHEFLADHDINILLVVFDKSSFAASRELFTEVENYLETHLIDEPSVRQRSLLAVEQKALAQTYIGTESQLELSKDISLEERIHNLDQPFSQALLSLIDNKGKNDVEVYKRANLDRKLFSKIRSSKSYMPSKRTALALAIALELTLPETNQLLERAGYTLSKSQKFDVIIEYFITSRHYDIFRINEVLFYYDQPLLGS